MGAKEKRVNLCYILDHAAIVVERSNVDARACNCTVPLQWVGDISWGASSSSVEDYIYLPVLLSNDDEIYSNIGLYSINICPDLYLLHKR